MKMIPGWLMDFMLKHFAKMFLPMMLLMDEPCMHRKDLEWM